MNSRGYKIKLKTTLMIDIDAYLILGYTRCCDTFFHGVKCLGYQDLNKCQIPAHPGLHSCKMPGDCLGGEGGHGHSWI